MNQVSDRVRKFFEDYERGGSTLDLELPTAQYGDFFMFAGPQGVQAVKKEDFLKVLPKRTEFFQAVGLVSSQIQSYFISTGTFPADCVPTGSPGLDEASARIGLVASKRVNLRSIALG